MAPPKNVTAPASAPAGKADLPEQYRGTKRYRVGAAGGFVGGQAYRAGDVVTLVDAIPSRTWTPLDSGKAPAAAAPVSAKDEGRASDTAI